MIISFNISLFTCSSQAHVHIFHFHKWKAIWMVAHSTSKIVIWENSMHIIRLSWVLICWDFFIRYIRMTTTTTKKRQHTETSPTESFPQHLACMFGKILSVALLLLPLDFILPFSYFVAIVPFSCSALMSFASVPCQCLYHFVDCHTSTSARTHTQITSDSIATSTDKSQIQRFCQVEQYISLMEHWNFIYYHFICSDLLIYLVIFASPSLFWCITYNHMHYYFALAAALKTPQYTLNRVFISTDNWRTIVK